MMEYQDSRIQMDLARMEQEFNNFYARHKGVIDTQIERSSHCEVADSCSNCERCLEKKIYQQLRQLKADTALRLNVLRTSAMRGR